MCAFAKPAAPTGVTNLAGATFQLTSDEDGENVIWLVPTDTIDEEDSTDQYNAYRVAKVVNANADTEAEKYEKGAVNQFTTDDNNMITISGLEAGTYYLHEIDAPEGYNKLKKPVEIQIIVEPDKASEYAPEEESDKYSSVSFENPLYVINGVANTVKEETIKVENKQGIELPETGSIGTIGLTVAGVAIVAIGLFAMPRKKKEQD